MWGFTPAPLSEICVQSYGITFLAAGNFRRLPPVSLVSSWHPIKPDQPMDQPKHQQILGSESWCNLKATNPHGSLHRFHAWTGETNH